MPSVGRREDATKSSEWQSRCECESYMSKAASVHLRVVIFTLDKHSRWWERWN